MSTFGDALVVAVGHDVAATDEVAAADGVVVQ